MPFEHIFSHITATSSPTLVFPDFLTAELRNWLLFQKYCLAHWWKTNDACHRVFCQTSERQLVELGFELTTH